MPSHYIQYHISVKLSDDLLSELLTVYLHTASLFSLTYYHRHSDYLGLYVTVYEGMEGSDFEEERERNESV